MQLNDKVKKDDIDTVIAGLTQHSLSFFLSSLFFSGVGFYFIQIQCNGRMTAVNSQLTFLESVV